MVGARHGMCELTARRGRGKAWEEHGHDVLRVNRPLILSFDAIACNVCYRQKHVLNLNKTTIRNFPFFSDNHGLLGYCNKCQMLNEDSEP
jgi:hypothetical protein